MSAPISNVRPPPDSLLTAIADYALDPKLPSAEALDTARWCLADTLACGIMALAELFSNSSSQSDSSYTKIPSSTQPAKQKGPPLPPT